MDDILVTNGSEAGTYSRSFLNDESEGFDIVRTEDWQRLTPQYRYRLNMREVESEDIFFGGQMCE
jgi:hypothetical protein